MTINGTRITFRMTPFRLVLIGFSLIFVGIVAYRLVNGLQMTNLTDAWPWGLWIYVDVKLGVALAAGGFTTAGIYYVLGVKKVKSVVKPAILTAWLGYCLVGFGLLMDLGRWYGWWHPIFSWGEHSVMFELYMCVLLYTIVLTCEFAPVLFKGLGLRKVSSFFTRLTAPLVIGGIALSTMHQSSLGSMYVLTLGKLNELWWTMLLPILYYSSAVAVGPAMVTCETALAGRFFRHDWDAPAMTYLAKWSGYVMTFYTVLRVGDLAVRGQLTALFALDTVSLMCLLELVIGCLLPLWFFWSYKLLGREMTQTMIVRNAVLMVLGVALNRGNVVFTGMAKAAGASYFPSVAELFLTFGLISVGILIYLFIVENFDVFPAHDQQAAPGPAQAHG
ncbi:MAG: polysulfide reductase NrfD [Desulfobulbus sp.]|jgi:Ni/Fe-hydrogenase subunit HybB-like protein|uniref:NrfD/PsrC family molybdoenzyme membrane anchor subunit n=1 Tax=Desulfobulbus sp. TaxID=895 RepID=UPI00284A5473|nr:NrfD/PsrC family molybdoenzyme membrane anchor subunit [Desulfobulbus sp.]MDR2551310.1 polysulfide reductase NrfD [Desulfobulbus sp.]